LNQNKLTFFYWFDLVQFSNEKIINIEPTILLDAVSNSLVCRFKLNINDLRAPLMTMGHGGARKIIEPGQNHSLNKKSQFSHKITLKNLNFGQNINFTLN
jgi:hypothetical protein